MTYNAITGTSCFSEALLSMKAGMKMRRKSWAPLQFVAICRDWNGQVEPGSWQFELQPFVYRRTANGSLVPWAPDQADLLAEDWEPAILPWEMNGPTREAAVPSEAIKPVLDITRIHVTEGMLQ